MKHLLLVWLLLGLMEHAWSQNSTNSIFLFEKFTNAYVYYRDGRVFQVPINYDLFKEKFIFLDKDQAENEFSDPDLVVSVKIGERTFLAVGDGNMAELMQQVPRILVQYSGSKRIQKNLTYGGKTETAAVDSYSTLKSGTSSNMKVGDDVFLGNMDYEFYLEVNGKLKHFSTEKQFLKIFSSQRDKLQMYIKENKIDFNAVDQVLKLCNYALSL